MTLSVFNNRNNQSRHDVDLKLASRAAILWGGGAIREAGKAVVNQVANCVGEQTIS